MNSCRVTGRHVYGLDLSSKRNSQLAVSKREREAGEGMICAAFRRGDSGCRRGRTEEGRVREQRMQEAGRRKAGAWIKVPVTM